VSIRLWMVLVGSVFLSSLAQLFLKLGLRGSEKLALSLDGIPALLTSVITNGYLLAGILSFGASGVLWLLVLSRADLSLAYPMVSLGYVFVVVLARLFLGETLSVWRMAGIATIVAGVIMIGRAG
jgi:drug/metabolite transporter (DMT)-like permease